ncbi:hypothetical protein GCM10018987_02910 [Streptomyces cremeus]
MGVGKTVRVLGGLYVPGVPRGWQRVDTEVIRHVRPVTAADPGPFVQQLISLHARDSGALRRVLLCQLTAPLQQDVHERARRTTSQRRFACVQPSTRSTAERATENEPASLGRGRSRRR